MIPAIGEQVSLIPKTRYAKNKVHEHGEIWKVIDLKTKVLFSNLEGVWLLLESLKDKDMRWVSFDKSLDFEVKGI